MSDDNNPLLATLCSHLLREPLLDSQLIERLALPSARLHTRRVNDADVGPGVSRIGGMPDLPAKFAWPRWLPRRPRDDKYGSTWSLEQPAPLGFIAQIDLSEMPRIDAALPASGWLYFFYDRYCKAWGFNPNDRGCCFVAYVDCPRSQLRRADAPSDLEAEHIANACSVKPIAELTLPEGLPNVEYGTPMYDAYNRLHASLIGDSSVHHRLLGWPQWSWSANLRQTV